MGHPKRKWVFQPSIFRGFLLLVSGRVLFSSFFNGFNLISAFFFVGHGTTDQKCAFQKPKIALVPHKSYLERKGAPVNGRKSMGLPWSSFHPYKWAMKKPSYFPLYWLLHRDPYHCLWNNPHITGVVCHPPKNALNSQGPFFHGSLVTSPILNIKISKISFWISCQLLLFHGIPLQKIS